MAREVFGSNFFGGEKNKIIKKGGEPQVGEHNWWEDWEAEREHLEMSYEEAVRHYEESLSVPPPEDWTTEEIIKALDKEAERKRSRRSKEAIKDASGLRGPIYRGRQFSETQGVVQRPTDHPGQRSGRKPRRHGREERRREAA